MRALALVLALALLLAGCARAPEPDPEPLRGDPTEAAGGVSPVECPLYLDILPPGEPVPRWRAGQWWNYTALDDAGLARGYVLYEVRGCYDVNGTFAHRVQETWLEYGGTSGYPETPRVVDRYFAMDTLNEVWARCNEPQRSMYPCEGRLREWDFPLEDGKRWTYPCCGDVVLTVHARSEQAADGTWRIHHADEPDGMPYTTWIYSSELGLFTDKIGSWWNGPGRWELRSQGEGPIPPRVLVDRGEALFSHDLACVHPEARGGARTTSVRGAWQASQEGMIVRLARALNETLLGEPWTDDRAPALLWNSSSGSTFESPLVAGPTRVTWRASYDPVPRSGPGGEAWLRNVIDRFAFQDAHGIEVSNVATTQGYEFWFTQGVDGIGLRDAGGYVETAYGTVLYWGPIFDAPEPSVPYEDAVASAKIYHRCYLDGRGMTEQEGYELQQESELPALMVHNGSLAYQVFLSYTTPPEARAHCSLTDIVLVDAVTGAILGRESPLCI